jgi:hypothetical protein
MKTTVELPDDLFREAKAYAASQGITLREVMERGLESVVRGAVPRPRRFRLKTITMKGQGITGDGDWNSIRSKIYAGHGG